MDRTHCVEIVALVSSDPDFRLGNREFMTCSVARSVQLYRSGGDLLDTMALDPRFTGAVIVIDSRVDDIAPLNLVDALRSSGRDIDVVVALDGDDSGLVQRAMLAGARAAVTRRCSDADLELAVRRVVAARHNPEQRITLHQAQSGQSPAIVSVVGARGGAGRSTCSALLGVLAARRGIESGLLDLDFQFGDLSLLFGIQPELGLRSVVHGLSHGELPAGFGGSICEGLTLYASDPEPESTELLSGHLAHIVEACSAPHRALFVNTGSFWTLLHAELLAVSDVTICVLDQTVPGVRSTIVLAAQLSKMGLSPQKLLYVVNRVRPAGVNPKEIARALGVERVWTIPDGGPETSLAIDAGGVDLIAGPKSVVTPAVETLLDEVAARTALVVPGVDAVRQRMRHRRGILWPGVKR